MKYQDIESATVELKRELPSKKQIVNTVIAFCNLYGGRLVIGVEDNLNIVGIPENQVGELTDTLYRSIINSCTPSILPLIYTQRIDDKLVLVVEVSAGMMKPYFRTDEGLVNGTYLRTGPETVKASPEMVRELQWEAQGHFLDEMPLHRGAVDDIDIEKFTAFLTKRGRIVENQSIEDLLIQHGLLTEEHRQRFPSIASIMLFGKNPQRLLPEAFVLCTHFQGVSGREVVASQDCKGSLFEQLDQTLSFITSRLNKKFTVEGVERTEVIEIPLLALREVLINAIVHRNYLIPGSIKVAIYDDRLEIFSPGNFPRPIPKSQLESGISLTRNSVISQFFRQAQFIEKLGSGWITVFSKYRKRGLKKPEVIDGAGFVKVILPRPTANNSPSNEQINHSQMIIQLLERNNEISAKDVIRKLQVSRQTASRALSQLTKEGKIQRLGQGASTRYQLIERGLTRH